MPHSKRSDSKPYENEDLQLIIEIANEAPNFGNYVKDYSPPFSVDDLIGILVANNLLKDKELADAVSMEIVRKNMVFLLEGIIKKRKTDNQVIQFFQKIDNPPLEVQPQKDGSFKPLSSEKHDLAALAVIRSISGNRKNWEWIYKCETCKAFYIPKRRSPTKRFCSTKCKQDWHNRKRIESGEHREYKRRKRKEGAPESYYG
jgi:hypothetical protein